MDGTHEFMEELARREDFVAGVQDDLAAAPEFGALAGTVGYSRGEARVRALRVLADYAVLFVAERMWRASGTGKRGGDASV